MTKFDIRKRDGLARTGFFQAADSTISLPAATETTTLFEGLIACSSINIPLSAQASLVREYPPVIPGGPVKIGRAHV